MAVAQSVLCTLCGDAPLQARRTCFSSGIEAKHQQAHFLGSEDLVQHLGYTITHIGGDGLDAVYGVHCV